MNIFASLSPTATRACSAEHEREQLHGQLRAFDCPDPDLVISQVRRYSAATTLTFAQAWADAMQILQAAGGKPWAQSYASLVSFVDSKAT